MKKSKPKTIPKKTIAKVMKWLAQPIVKAPPKNPEEKSFAA